MRQALMIFVILVSCICSFISGCDWGRMKYIGRPDQEPSGTITKVETRFDTVERLVKIPGKSFTRIDSVFVATNQTIDTAAILKQFNYAYLVSDTFRNSELAIVTLDSVYQNQITARSLQYKILRPDSIITKEITSYRNRLYAGIGLVSSTQLTGLNPKILFTHKQGIALDAGVIIGPSRPGFSCSIFFSIK